ncbi:cobalamin-dependent protein, partial [Micrococcus sp. SIMBA_144]
GIKVTPTDLIKQVQDHQPDFVGLSGLLVKSAQQMVLTAQDMKQAKISIPIMVGGAALSRKFTDNKISAEYDGPVFYAKDAMEGLALSNQLSNEEEKRKLVEEHAIKK